MDILKKIDAKLDWYNAKFDELYRQPGKNQSHAMAVCMGACKALEDMKNELQT